MPILYKPCGDGEVPAHLCRPCITPEQGGVRGGAFIRSDYIPRNADGLIDSIVESFSWWETGITDGKIFVIPSTRGTFDGGAAVTAPGFGDNSEIVTGKKFTVVMSDPDHRENEEFYAAIADAPGAYHAAWRTDSELRISDTPVTIDPVDNTEEDVNSQVAWAVNITWSQKKKTVQVFTLNKQVFQCFDTTGDSFYSTPPTFSTFPNVGGEQILTIMSAVDGNTVGFSAQGTIPSWVHLTITGNQAKVVTDANIDIARNYELVLVQSGSGRTMTKNIPQTAATAILSIAAISQQPAAGGNFSGQVTSTLNGSPVGWTFDSAASSPDISIVSGEGTATPVFNVAANAGAQRSLNIVIKQSVGTKTATRAVSQAAAVAPTLTGYIGVLPDVDPPTEASILALPTFAAGNQDVYHEYSANEERPAIVQPASLPSYTHAINPIGDDEIPLFKEIQMSVGGVMCKVMYPKLAFGDGLPYGWTFKK